LKAKLKAFARNKRAVAAVQVVALAVLLAFVGYAFRDVWADAAPLLRDADLVQLGLALLVLAGYYLLFVVGWMMILAALGIRLPYRLALQAEMLSMLAKYVPGGVWTPAARIVAVRRYGPYDTGVLLASILLEAALSAIAGVLVFVASIPLIGGADAPLLPVIAFAVVVAFLVHPRVFRRLATVVLRPFGTPDPPVLPYRTMLRVLAFYAVTWPIGGLALFFLIRSVGGDPGIETIPYLGGASAIGAIVAVLVVFAPSGLGVREASVYGLMLAVVPAPVALGATILNRLAITLVEAVLLLVGGVALRGTPPPPAEPEPRAVSAAPDAA
jgi:uncharacterized membrane protein YbhN (UPF0104 family)